MKQQIMILIVTVFLLLASLSFVSISNAEDMVIASGNILYVGGSGPGNYSNIQDAVDDANPGDTVFVYSGTYDNGISIYVNKSINLIGENQDTTVIDGNKSRCGIIITANGTTVSDFKIQNCSGSCYPYGCSGIFVYNSYYIVSDISIINCRLENNTNGIVFSSVSLSIRCLFLVEYHHVMFNINMHKNPLTP